MRQCTASSAMTAIGSVISPTVQARPAGTRNQCDGVSTISNYGLYSISLPCVSRVPTRSEESTREATMTLPLLRGMSAPTPTSDRFGVTQRIMVRVRSGDGPAPAWCAVACPVCRRDQGYALRRSLLPGRRSRAHDGADIALSRRDLDQGHIETRQCVGSVHGRATNQLLNSRKLRCILHSNSPWALAQ